MLSFKQPPVLQPTPESFAASSVSTKAPLDDDREGGRGGGGMVAHQTTRSSLSSKASLHAQPRSTATTESSDNPSACSSDGATMAASSGDSGVVLSSAAGDTSIHNPHHHQHQQHSAVRDEERSSLSKGRLEPTLSGDSVSSHQPQQEQIVVGSARGAPPMLVAAQQARRVFGSVPGSPSPSVDGNCTLPSRRKPLLFHHMYQQPLQQQQVAPDVFRHPQPPPPLQHQQQCSPMLYARHDRFHSGAMSASLNSSPLPFRHPMSTAFSNGGRRDQRSNSLVSSSAASEIHNSSALAGNWQLFAVALHRSNSPNGFGIAISGGTNNPNFFTGDPSIVISDVLKTGPAHGLLQVNDRLVSVNGLSLVGADYGTAIAMMKDSQQLNMVVKRRVPVPFIELEQRTLKFTLSKSRKKDDFGIVLGCRFFIKEIQNPKLAEKEPGLREGDTVLRINGQPLDGITLEEASRMLQRSREKLSLVVQRDVRHNPSANANGAGTTPVSAAIRWPSQQTVYQPGSVGVTPSESPTHFPQQQPQTLQQHYSIPAQPSQALFCSSHGSPALMKRHSDSHVPVTAPPLPQHTLASQQRLAAVRAAQPQQPGQIHWAPMTPNWTTTRGGTIHPHHLRMNGGGGMPQQSLRHYGSVSALVQAPQSQSFHASQQQPLHHTPPSNTPSSVHSLNFSSNGHQAYHQHPVVSAGGPPYSLTSAGVGGLMSQSVFVPPTGNYNGSASNNNPYSYDPAQLPRPLNNRSPRHLQLQNPQRLTVNLQRPPGGSLGIRVVGGNQLGIFVSSVQEGSPANQHGIQVGDKLVQAGERLLEGATREEAVEALLGLGNDIQLQLERGRLEEFSALKNTQSGDSFYIRTHFCYQPPKPDSATESAKSTKQTTPELAFQPGDIFHVADTMAGSTQGYWQVTKIYSAESEKQQNGDCGSRSSDETNISGLIPNQRVAEHIAKQTRSTLSAAAHGPAQTEPVPATMSSSTLGRVLFRRRISKMNSAGGGNTDGGGSSSANDEFSSSARSTGIQIDESQQPELFQLPAYERVSLKKPAFHRPVVLWGSLADVAFDQLVTNFHAHFGAPEFAKGAGAIPLSAVDSVMAAQKHCVLTVGPAAVEKLLMAQYAPIVVLVDVDSKGRVRELRSKAGAATSSARKLCDEAQRLKRDAGHMLTATLDASKEDAWFDALRHLIFHLQERRCWMPEKPPPAQSVDNLTLMPMMSASASFESATADEQQKQPKSSSILRGEPIVDRPPSQKKPPPPAVIPPPPPLATASSPHAPPPEASIKTPSPSKQMMTSYNTNNTLDFPFASSRGDFQEHQHHPSFAQNAVEFEKTTVQESPPHVHYEIRYGSSAPHSNGGGVNTSCVPSNQQNGSFCGGEAIAKTSPSKVDSSSLEAVDDEYGELVDRLIAEHYGKPSNGVSFVATGAKNPPRKTQPAPPLPPPAASNGVGRRNGGDLLDSIAATLQAPFIDDCPELVERGARSEQLLRGSAAFMKEASPIYTVPPMLQANKIDMSVHSAASSSSYASSVQTVVPRHK